MRKANDNRLENHLIDYYKKIRFIEDKYLRGEEMTKKDIGDYYICKHNIYANRMIGALGKNGKKYRRKAATSLDALYIFKVIPPDNQTSEELGLGPSANF